MSIDRRLDMEVRRIVSQAWSKRRGLVVPETSNVALYGGSIEITATFLYADLASSSMMAKNLDRRITAKIIKSFIAISCRIIRAMRGEIRSFDGDRVMGIFIGKDQQVRAARCSLMISYAMTHYLSPRLNTAYPAIASSGIEINHGVGIDSGTVMAVRGGARGDNDLIWIGRAANLAAKLSDERMPGYWSTITAAVYNQLTPAALHTEDGFDIWVRYVWSYLGENIVIYRSGHGLKPARR